MPFSKQFRTVDTRNFKECILGHMWIVGNLSKSEGIALRNSVGRAGSLEAPHSTAFSSTKVWMDATDDQILETKTNLVNIVFGDRDPEFVKTFTGCPYEDYIFMTKKYNNKRQYIIGVWHGDEVTVYYARLPECSMVGGSIEDGGRNVQRFSQIKNVLSCCSIRAVLSEGRAAGCSTPYHVPLDPNIARVCDL